MLDGLLSVFRRFHGRWCMCPPRVRWRWTRVRPPSTNARCALRLPRSGMATAAIATWMSSSSSQAGGLALACASTGLRVEGRQTSCCISAPVPRWKPRLRITCSFGLDRRRLMGARRYNSAFTLHRHTLNLARASTSDATRRWQTLNQRPQQPIPPCRRHSSAFLALPKAAYKHQARRCRMGAS